MELTPVKSASISAVGHDPETNTLTVKFNSGATYEYADVPADVHAALMAAPSIGRAFAESVKGGGFTHTKLDKEE